MKKVVLLPALLAIIVLVLPFEASYAQTEYGGVQSRKGNTNTRADKKAREAKSGKPAALFPKATREEPKQTGAPSVLKKLSGLYELQQKGEDDQIIEKSDAILADPKAEPYDRATAAYYAAFSWQSKDTEGYSHAITSLERAISENGLTNNMHYTSMFQLAGMLNAENRDAESLKYVERYLVETGSEDPKANLLKAHLLYQTEHFAESAEIVKKLMAASTEPDEKLIRLLVANYLELDKPMEAAPVIEQLLEKKPNDKALLQNLAVIYQQGNDDIKAGQVFDRMHNAGLITESKDYESAYRLLVNMEGREKDAVAIINEGFEKQILSPSFDAYAGLGNAHYNMEQIPQAIDAWSKAAELSKDGEMFLNVGKLQSNEEQWVAARESARKAIAKGVKKPGDAWVVIGRSEFGLGNKPAVLAAYREAAKFPETKKVAEAALRQASGK